MQLHLQTLFGALGFKTVLCFMKNGIKLQDIELRKIINHCLRRIKMLF